MERFVRFAAPVGFFDFLWKLATAVVICGLLNHVRDILLMAPDNENFLHNLGDAAFTAVPMCALGLFLIGHLNSLQRNLHIQAMRDELTGLRNRRWFMDHCPSQFGKEDVLMLCDIDHFKRINDTYGHHIGDQCLRQFSDHLVAVLPDQISPARIGGEEFGILLHGVSDSDIEDIADIITLGIQLEAPDGAYPKVTASVGIIRSQAAMSCKSAFARADEALYLAKESGRARYRFFRDMVDIKAVARPPHPLSQSAAAV